ncbi:hypothetical protein KNU39_gp76 [Gordonia phage Mutzi]|uniref:Uncharacterized protein n=1 Tax=Gordonia phage Mutzi TaxID=2500789 RepID=A0A411AXS3_9CAUD|nr:hypothetical protein KNU39_gp76 [Gordonia phage Mutzi]QAX92886.1 hypothetical protein SEA_MUTZI_76 [Gordonia phage Mutzi]QWY84763.1 hypothetical protein SEA_YUNGMONEY_77 [Gordonia phage YungMoney]
MLWRALALRLTPNLKLRRTSRPSWNVLLEWKRPHSTRRLGAYRWGSPHGTMPPPGFSWKPWPHLHRSRSLEISHAELYWPGIGGVSVSESHHISLLFDHRGREVALRDSWLAHTHPQDKTTERTF